MTISEKLRIGATVKAKVFDIYKQQYVTVNGFITDITDKYIEINHFYIIHSNRITEIH